MNSEMFAEVIHPCTRCCPSDLRLSALAPQLEAQSVLPCSSHVMRAKHSAAGKAGRVVARSNPRLLRFQKSLNKIEAECLHVSGVFVVLSGIFPVRSCRRNCFPFGWFWGGSWLVGFSWPVFRVGSSPLGMAEAEAPDTFMTSSDTLPNYFLEHLRQNPHILAPGLRLTIGLDLKSGQLCGKRMNFHYPAPTLG